MRVSALIILFSLFLGFKNEKQNLPDSKSNVEEKEIIYNDAVDKKDRGIQNINDYVLNKYNVEINYTKSSSQGGGLLYNNPNKGYDGEQCGDSYSIDVRYQGKIHFLVLEKIDCNNTKNRKFIDVLLPFHEFKNKGELQIYFCEKNGISDSKIIAITLDEDEENELEYFTKIGMAWMLDLSKEKIVRIDAEGIRCSNESYGI